MRIASACASSVELPTQPRNGNALIGMTMICFEAHVDSLGLNYKFLPPFTVKLGERFRGGTVLKTEEIIEGVYVYRTWRTIRQIVGFDVYTGYSKTACVLFFEISIPSSRIASTATGLSFPGLKPGAPCFEVIGAARIALEISSFPSPFTATKDRLRG